MTIEKDKEDQNKYHLSYPKPPVLDIKRENRDINVAGWANNPKFPKWRLGENVVLQLMDA